MKKFTKVLAAFCAMTMIFSVFSATVAAGEEASSVGSDEGVVLEEPAPESPGIKMILLSPVLLNLKKIRINRRKNRKMSRKLKSPQNRLLNRMLNRGLNRGVNRIQRSLQQNPVTFPVIRAI